MKIGLSLSRCVRDIYEEKVDIEDVLVIIARTDFDPEIDSEWEGIWSGYHHGGTWNHPEWANIPEEDSVKIRKICVELQQSGKLHQPRQFGAHPRRLPYIWLETVLPNTELDKNPAASAAWKKFQTVAGLTSVVLDEDHRV